MKIKNIGIISLVFLAVACVSPQDAQKRTQSATANQKRGTASFSSLEGTYLGVGDYVNHERNPALRLYLDEIETEPGSYYAVLLEYVNLLEVFPKYVTSNKLKDLSEKIGFLNNIVEKIWLYKVVPAREDGRYDMIELRADSRRVEVLESENPRQLILSNESGLSHPLEHASISPGKTGHAKTVFFPKPSDKSLQYGTEYLIAHLVYGKIGLNSTWRDKLLPGLYLSAYGKEDDVVLKLTQSGDAMQAYFNVSPDFVRLNMSREQIEKREEVFTNPKSAFLEGGFVMREPVDGMFVFSPMHSNENTKTIDEMTGRIGVFVDIFDATTKLGQEVVELITVNTEDPLDFHMHYEHPENGEGEKFNKSGPE